MWGGPRGQEGVEEVPVTGPLCSGTRTKQAGGEVWGSQGLGSSQQRRAGGTCGGATMEPCEDPVLCSQRDLFLPVPPPKKETSPMSPQFIPHPP